MRKNKNIFLGNKGIGIIELMISCLIIVISFVAFFYGLVSCFKLAQVSKESFYALQEVSNRMEVIRSSTFMDIFTNFNGRTFEVTGLPTGSTRGSITVDNSMPDLVRVYIAVCWRSSDDRIIGEDSDLDGALSVSEDVNNNNRMDSPVTLTTFITRR